MEFISLFGTPKPEPTVFEKIKEAVKQTKANFTEQIQDLVEGEKEIFANAGAERNATAIANTDAFSFAYRNGGSRKRKARRAECDFVTGSDQWFRELSAKSAATSQFGTRTHDTQSRLQVRLSRSR